MKTKILKVVLWTFIFLFSFVLANGAKKIEKKTAQNSREKLQSLFEQMRKSENGIYDLECLFIKQVTKNNYEFPTSFITYRFKKNPDTIFIQYLNRYEGRKLLYVDGQNDNQILVRPEGFFSFMTIKVDPFSEKAMAEDVEPITKLKFGVIINEIQNIIQQRIFNPNLELRENENEDGIPVYRIFLWEKETNNYFNFAIDKRTNLPYKLNYRVNNNRSLLIFKDLKLNLGLRQEDFSI